MQWTRSLALAALACVWLMAQPSLAQSTTAQSGIDPNAVDVEIVLAADGSGSIDDEELALQRQGYAAAITDEEVLRTILGGLYGKIAIAYVEWGGPFSQHTIVDWTIIASPADAQAFAQAVIDRPRAAEGWNSISEAIAYSTTMIESNEWKGLRKIIDVSGDGPNFGGRPLSETRQRALDAGITINALVVKSRGGGYPGPRGEPLEDHYRNDVIGGTGAFVIVADEELSFEAAIRRKLILEIASGPNTILGTHLAATE